MHINNWGRTYEQRQILHCIGKFQRVQVHYIKPQWKRSLVTLKHLENKRWVKFMEWMKWFWVLLALEWRFSCFSLVLSRSHTPARQFCVTFETITTSKNRPLAGRDDFFAGWWRSILFLFKIMEYGVSWLRKLSEIHTQH